MAPERRGDGRKGPGAGPDTGRFNKEDIKGAVRRLRGSEEDENKDTESLDERTGYFDVTDMRGVRRLPPQEQANEQQQENRRAADESKKISNRPGPEPVDEAARPYLNSSDVGDRGLSPEDMKAVRAAVKAHDQKQKEAEKPRVSAEARQKTGVVERPPQKTGEQTTRIERPVQPAAPTPPGNFFDKLKKWLGF